MIIVAQIIIFAISIASFTLVFSLWRRNNNAPDLRQDLRQFVQETLSNQFLQMQNLIQQQQQTLIERLHELNHQHTRNFTDMRQQFDANQLKSLQILQTSLQQGLQTTTQQVNETLRLNADDLGKRVDKLTESTEFRLKEISGHVDKRLTEGFEKTTATFADIVKRLALIDEAQKKITELSGNVVSLQEVLADKRARGAFGEIQLEALVHNLIPDTNASMQYSLSNGKRCDCILFLPDPTGNIAIDAKFPLESYQTMVNFNLSNPERDAAKVQFKKDVKTHIKDIASKYIIPGETADSAFMFLPAEAIFAEIHSNHPDLVEFAHQSKVWLVSPTTMMAILTTAAAVIKDAATRKQVCVIQEHLNYLHRDFARFQKRMDKLEKHIDQEQSDVKDVQTSARKITGRFARIEKVDLEKTELIELEPDLIEAE